MYDTIRARLDTFDTDCLGSVLSKYKKRADPDTGDLWQYGELDGLRVRTTPTGLLTVEGSLAKYRFGNNVETLTRADAGEAIKSIEDRLNLPIGEARVFRLDIGQNFIMQRPVVDYLSLLLAAPYHKRTDFSDRETVNFQNKLRILSFYDKAHELEARRQVMPGAFSGKRILRYEARYIKRIGNQFGRHAVYAKDLSDEIFYRKAIDKWKDQYFLIKKVRKDQALNMNGQRQFVQSLAYYGMETLGGAERVIDLISGARQRGEISKKTRQRLRKLVLEVAQGKGGIVGADRGCIEELDHKVMQIAANWQ
jgi:hypothetical protein